MFAINVYGQEGYEPNSSFVESEPNNTLYDNSSSTETVLDEFNNLTPADFPPADDPNLNMHMNEESETEANFPQPQK